MKMKRVVATLLAASLVVGSVGCMQKSDSGSKKSGSKQEHVEAPEDPLGKYEKTVKITTVLPENAGIQWQDGDSYDDNPWYRAYKERLNIEVKNDWVSNDYSTKLNLTIAEGEKSLPDVFCVGEQNFQQLIDGDLIWDLTDLYEKYASDRIKGYMEQEKDVFELAKRDGKLMGIPQLSFGIIDQPKQIWVRQDWAEEAGIKEINTIADLDKAARTLKEKHGKYGIAEDQKLDSFKALTNAWGAHMGYWEERDGEIVYGSVQPEMKEALAQFATWYKDGVLNQDFVTSDMDKMFQGCINGEVGIQPMEQWFGYTPGADIIANQGEKAVFDAYKIPSANGAKVIYPIEPANYGYIVVSKTCKNPEAALKLLNFYAYQANDAKGKEDPDFIASLNDHAYANIPYALRVIDPNTDYNIYETVQESLKKYEAGEEVDRAELGGAIVKYEDCVKWIETKEPASVGNWNQQGSPKSAYGLSKEILDNNEYFIDARHGKQIKALLNAGSTLDDILIEGFTKIIVGEKPVEYFDTLVDDWKKAGGEEATKEVNEVCK